MIQPQDPTQDPTHDPSKTERKKAMHALQALGERLVTLPAARLAEVPLEEDLREAIEAARGMTKHEARRRQLQYIGRLMRDIDPAPIRAALDRFDGQSAEATREMNAAERWRDRLIADDAALTEFAARYPGTDLQALRALLREVRRERKEADPAAPAGHSVRAGRHFRDLYRMIRAADAARDEDTP